MKHLLSDLFTGKTDSTLFQFIRYTFVGGAAFVLDYAALWASVELLGLDPLAGAAIGFVLGLTLNYLLCCLWVFGDSGMKDRWTEFAVFAVIGVVGLGFTELFMWLFTDLCGIHYMVSKAITVMLVYIWNFTARKYIVFSAKPKEEAAGQCAAFDR